MEKVPRINGAYDKSLETFVASPDGRILAFLHSDTKLPVNWDSKLLKTFHRDPHDSKPVRVNAAAFGFGVDTNGLRRRYSSSTGHSSSSSSSSNSSTSSVSPLSSYYPPGLRAVQVTANLRCRLWSLPYGDQCLCVPADIFHHVGGYPHQCFMEDYELIALLRRRSALIHKFLHNNDNSLEGNREALKIIPGPPALCSPRRWQRLS